jgi:hypothetical protein
MFKAGDKVFSFRHGIVTLVETKEALTSGFSIGIKTEIGIEGHTAEGRCLIKDKYPSVISLEKAEKMGLIRKKVKLHKGLRVKYYDKSTDAYYIAHNLIYKSEEEFEFECPEVLLISFVDEKLNECPPPQETIEWEEIV